MTYTTKAIGWMTIVVGIGLLWTGCESVSSEQAKKRKKINVKKSAPL